ncbi:MAG: hydantoinase/oxoprolinase family protein [Chloroflexi bacterium]|nr:hydantoinase/oxoprolinase family protein [Chloroflexota bacterium]
MAYRAGFDVGGTFTDFAFQDEETGEITIGKRLTTASDPSAAVLDGLRELAPGTMVQAVHGTTLGANIVIEKKGAPTGLITTRGFRDVLEIQRQLRYNMYDYQVDKHPPLISRDLIWEVGERVAYDGSVLTSLDEEGARDAIRKAVASGVRSLAISLLHAYVNPKHERRLAELAVELGPELLVSLSSVVSPQIREYERTNTTVVNAYIRPAMQTYLARLEAGLAELDSRGELYLMQTNGGIARARTLAETPVRAIESGPAAGALMAAFYGKLTGFADLISFDMGGTTAKACLIEGGQPRTTGVFEIDRSELKAGSGLPLNVPGMDLVEIGAGGGSIARVRRGLVAVGPESAGAAPGPACYGQGGDGATVTDANVLLGYLNPDYFLGGEMALDRDAAARVVGRDVAQPLGLSLEQAAWGVHQLVTVNMERATRVVSVERGRDPRQYALVAFGGAGPIHGCRLARDLGVRTVILPAAAGVTSALGLLVADPRFDLAQTVVTHLIPEALPRLGELYAELEAEGRRLLAEAGVAGDVRFLRSADLRYVGQGFEIEAPVPAGTPDAAWLERLRRTHDDVYASHYGYSEPSEPVEATNWKLTALCAGQGLRLPRATSTGSSESARKGSRPAYFPEAGGFTTTAIYDRYRLAPGAEIVGPAIVEERESTTVILPGDGARVDEYANLIVTIGERS